MVNALTGSDSSRNGPNRVSTTLERHGADLRAHRDVPASAGAARTRRSGFEVGESGEVEDVAQLAQFLAAQHVGVGQVVAEEPVFHLLQQQGRIGGGQFAGVDGFKVSDVLVVDLVNEVERGPSAASSQDPS